MAAEGHDRQFGFDDQFQVVGSHHEITGGSGDCERLFDGVPVGVGPVGGERKPEWHSAGSAGQNVGVVTRVEHRVIHEWFEVAGVLGMGPAGGRWLPVDERRTIEWGKEPLVGIHDERIATLHPVVEVSDRGRSQSRTPVGPIDMEPGTESGTGVGHRVEGVDDSHVGGSGGGHHGEHLGPGGTTVDGRGDGITGEAQFAVKVGEEYIDVHDTRC